MALFGHAPTTGDFTYQIDWGDGSTPDAGTATITDPGDSSDPLVGSFGGQHVYALAGNYYVAATITDPAGGSTTQTFEVTVNDAPPADSGDSGDDGGSSYGDVSQSQTSVTDTTPPSSLPLDLSLSDLPLPAPIAPITSVVSSTSGSGGVTLSGTSSTVSLTSPTTGVFSSLSGSGSLSLSGVLSTVSFSTSSSTSSVAASDASQMAASGTDATTAGNSGSADSTASGSSSQSASVTTADSSQSFQTMTSGINTTSSSDPALLTAVRQALAMPAGAAVMSTDWARLTTLSADSNQVLSLNGLQYAVNLQSLTLVPSNFADPGHLTNLSLLSGLTNLKSLTLQCCGLNDAVIATLPSLPILQTLDLRYNNINTVPSVVANLPSLNSLFLYGNPLGGNGTQTWYQSLSGKLLTVDIAPQNTDAIIANINPTNPTATYQALAGVFYNLPIEIYQYLVNTIQYQAYQGAMKGPLAVLETKAGNDWDTDSLLAALLQQTGIQTQYASAMVLVDIPTVMKWLAVKTPAAAYDALDQAGLGPSFCQIQSGSVVSATLSQATYIAFNHAWLQATVTPPGATSPQTVYLDPTWKFKDLQAGIPNILTAVPFNTTGTGGYLESVQDESAAAFYENEVRTYLAQYDPSQTIADVPYDGPITPQTISALPLGPSCTYFIATLSVNNAIPASLTDQVQISVDIPQASLGVTVSSGQSSSTITVNPAVFTPSMVGEPVVVNTPSGGAQAYTISSCTSTVATVQGSVSWASGDTLAIPGFSSLQNIPNISLERITVGYDTSDPLKPRLYINGVDTADSALDGSATGNVNLVVQMACNNFTHVYTRSTGQYMAIGLDASQMSEQLLTAARKVVNDANIAKANGVAYSNDALTGGLLNLAMIDFYLNCDQDDAEIGGLTGALPVHSVIACGIATANSTVQDTGSGGNLQIRYLPDAMGIDVAGNWNSTSIDEAAVACLPNQQWPYGVNSGISMPQEDVQHYILMGYDSSSWESLVWEDLTNTPTICTAKSIEMANASGANPVVTLGPATTWTQVLADLSGLGTGASGTQICNDVYGYLQQGYTVTVPTNYTDVGTGTNGWQGVGYFVTDSNGIVRANMIDGGWGGVMQAPHGGDTGGYANYIPTNFLTQDNLYQTLGVAGDPIEVSTGDVLHDETDISIPNLGSPLGMARQYDSINTVASGNEWSDRGMGEGWSFTYSDEFVLSTSLNNPLDNDPAGTRIWFTDGGVELKFTPNGSGYTTPAGIFGQLADYGSGWRWTDTAGNTVTFDSLGRLVSKLDRYGDGVYVNYVDSTPHILTAQRMLNNNVASLECYLKFTYTGNHITAITAYDSKQRHDGPHMAIRLQLRRAARLGDGPDQRRLAPFAHPVQLLSRGHRRARLAPVRHRRGRERDAVQLLRQPPRLPSDRCPGEHADRLPQHLLQLGRTSPTSTASPLPTRMTAKAAKSKSSTRTGPRKAAPGTAAI